MNVIVSSGGTVEAIDTVRSIQNTSTGRLGSKIAEAFLEIPDAKVFYIAAKNAVKPEKNLSENLKVINVVSVADVKNAFEELCSKIKADVIVHSMAISDYRVKKASSFEDVKKAIKKDRDDFCDLRDLSEGGKLSSSIDDLVLFMERTPKIIGLLRNLAPEAIITGFKLLDSVSHENLIDTAFNLLKKNRCDFVLANDLSQIDSFVHKGYLIDKNKDEKAFNTKEEIALGIRNAICAELKKRGK